MLPHSVEKNTSNIIIITYLPACFFSHPCHLRPLMTRCLQVYEDWDSYKVNDMLEVYGVLSVSPALSALADEK